jgi:hypothetical protein
MSLGCYLAAGAVVIEFNALYTPPNSTAPFHLPPRSSSPREDAQLIHQLNGHMQTEEMVQILAG